MVDVIAANDDSNAELNSRTSKISSDSAIDNKSCHDFDKIELMPSKSVSSITDDSAFDSESRRKNKIINYYEKYGTETAKTLINTLFIPAEKICRQCTEAREIGKTSMVYSDRLIYGKQSLYAREVFFYHFESQTQQLFFRRCGDLIKFRDDYMPIVSLNKTIVSDFIYPHVNDQDIFNYNSPRAPDILFIHKKVMNASSSTEIYHRVVINAYCRLSFITACKPMVFKDSQVVKYLSHNDNLQSWMDSNKHATNSSSKNCNDFTLTTARAHQHRSSLLMLEPLLMMPDFPTSRSSSLKNRITHSEHVKIVRMVIAYTLSFFLLTIVTFYIVYFA